MGVKFNFTIVIMYYKNYKVCYNSTQERGVNMDNNVCLNEEQFQKINKKIRKTGVTLLIVGILLLVIGIVIVLQENEFGAVGIILGFFSCFIGLILRFFIANQRQMNAYFTQQSIPVAKEGIKQIASSTGVAAKEIAKGIREGLKDDKE